MRKSNWSDLLSALAMSERDNVRRLLESAMIKALAVISEIKTSPAVNNPQCKRENGRTLASFAEQNRGCSRVQRANTMEYLGSYHLLQSS